MATHPSTTNKPGIVAVPPGRVKKIRKREDPFRMITPDSALSGLPYQVKVVVLPSLTVSASAHNGHITRPRRSPTVTLYTMSKERKPGNAPRLVTTL